MTKASWFLVASLVTAFATVNPLSLPVGAETAQKQQLHRADFRVEGASCVMCLRRIAHTLRDQKGVLKADVSVFKPYWAIIIYDGNQTNMQKLTQSIKTEHVRLMELEDTKIDAVPEIIIPKGMVGKPMPALKDK